ncbi:MAG: hypothetical protein KC441_18215, partial [Anaerolineales bacterium]|nr:hypothetical protein [Anaerolineales bacterium]
MQQVPKINLENTKATKRYRPKSCSIFLQNWGLRRHEENYTGNLFLKSIMEIKRGSRGKIT